MSHSCSDGFDEEIEWLFQLKGDGGVEIVFQWFQVQCKMWGLHVIVQSSGCVSEFRTHGVYW